MGNDATTTAVREPEVMLPEVEPGNLPAVNEPRQEPQRTHGGAPEGIQISDRVIVRMSDEVDQLFAAMAAAQEDPKYGDVSKSKTARVQSRKGEGSSYAYTYETLADVIDATRTYLAKQGITVFQFPFPGNTSVTIRTMLAHKSGQWLYNDLSARISMPDPQAVGSGITYLRRYAMKSILNVAAEDEDDDGEAASVPPSRQEAPPRPAQRKSQQTAPPPQQAQSASQASQDAPAATGKIRTLEEKSGGMLVTLETGFRCSTRSSEMMDALRNHKELDRVIELRTHPASDPRKYAPILDEIAIQAE